VHFHALTVLQKQLVCPPTTWPTQAISGSSKANRLRNYTVEIVAFTFGAIFDDLNTTLLQQPITAQTTFILTPEERADLLRLSTLVRKLHTRCERNELLTVSNAEKEELYTSIMQPAAKVGGKHMGAESFFLDLIGSWGDHECDPSY
jgi:hypothetical protein